MATAAFLRSRAKRARGLAPLLLVALLGVLPGRPAQAFNLQAASVSPESLAIPCGGSADLWVTVGGTLDPADVTNGTWTCYVVIPGWTVDSTLANAKYSTKSGDVAGAYVTRTVRVTLKCTEDCHLVMADGTKGPSSASISVEGVTGGDNFGSGKVWCSKDLPKGHASLGVKRTVAQGERVDYSAVIIATSSKGRSLRGMAYLLLGQIGTPSPSVLAQHRISRLGRGRIFEGAFEMPPLPPGAYRIGVRVVNERNRVVSEFVTPLQVVHAGAVR